jgi:hypothetical protein
MKTWKPGAATEDWQRAICKRDAKQANDMLLALCYITSEAPCLTIEACSAHLSTLTGEEIARALLAYRDSALRSIANGEKLTGRTGNAA